MKTTWVNHASFIIEHDSVRLICDPWLEGTAFDNGWAHLSKTVLAYEDFKDITHIWFSHEHPDHFSPPSINKTPKEYRENITVLFQKSTDGKVAAYCRKMGFKTIIEMESDTYYSLSSDFHLMCNPFTDGDSWFYLKTSEANILNLNDCIADSIQSVNAIAKHINGPVDVLFTQFGYANKVGNTGDRQTRIDSSLEKLERIRLQSQIFKPKAIVPFASYVYFCHDENKYMNEGMNRIDDVAAFIETELSIPAVVLYPGEQWEILSAHDNASSIAQYRQDYRKVEQHEVSFLKSEQADKAILAEEAEKFRKKLLEDNGAIKNTLFRFYPAFHIWLEDYNESLSFSMRSGLQASGRSKEQCDISLASSALLYSFKFLWGGDTLLINARFQTCPQGNYEHVRPYYAIAGRKNRAEKETYNLILDVLTRSMPLHKQLKSVYRKVKQLKS